MEQASKTGRMVSAEEARAMLSSAFGDRFVSKIDFDGHCWMWKGSQSTYRGKTYGHYQLGGRGSKQESPHRLVFATIVSDLSDGEQVDHRYHCSGLCVRPDHLRAASHAENQRNRSGAQKSNRFGVRGVYVTTAGRFATRVQCDGKFHTAGTYATAEEARTAVAALRDELFGEQWAGVA